MKEKFLNWQKIVNDCTITLLDEKPSKYVPQRTEGTLKVKFKDLSSIGL
jgi:hypothetical protein